MPVFLFVLDVQRLFVLLSVDCVVLTCLVYLGVGMQFQNLLYK